MPYGQSDGDRTITLVRRLLSPQDTLGSLLLLTIIALVAGGIVFAWTKHSTALVLSVSLSALGAGALFGLVPFFLTFPLLRLDAAVHASDGVDLGAVAAQARLAQVRATILSAQAGVLSLALLGWAGAMPLFATSSSPWRWLIGLLALPLAAFARALHRLIGDVNHCQDSISSIIDLKIDLEREAQERSRTSR